MQTFLTLKYKFIKAIDRDLLEAAEAENISIAVGNRLVTSKQPLQLPGATGWLGEGKSSSKRLFQIPSAVSETTSSLTHAESRHTTSRFDSFAISGRGNTPPSKPVARTSVHRWDSKTSTPTPASVS